MKRIILHKEKQCSSAIQEIKKLELGGLWEVVIRKYIKKRSGDQNSLYWVWLEEIAKSQGSDKETVHDYFKSKYGYWRSGEFLGHVIAVPISTTKYNTKQFADYMMKIEAEMAQFGIQLPHPGDEELMDWFV